MGLNYGPIFRRLWTKVHQITSADAGDRSLQRHFPIVDILFCSGDIRNWSAKSSEIAPKKHVFGPKFFWGGGPHILDLVFNTAPISDHVAKFHGDRPRDRGDLALKKKRKKERKKQQQNIRACAMRYSNGRVLIITMVTTELWVTVMVTDANANASYLCLLQWPTFSTSQAGSKV